MKLRTEHPPTSEEIQLASGQKTFDASIHAKYLQKIDAQTSGIKEAFAKQKAKAAVWPFQMLLSSFNHDYRSPGIRQNSKSCSLSGSLCAINHLTRLRNLSLFR
jgi:hypothetical protein